MYKGQKVQSSDNDSDHQKSDGESSKDSADEYFNMQRKMIKRKLLGSKNLQG